MQPLLTGFILCALLAAGPAPAAGWRDDAVGWDADLLAQQGRISASEAAQIVQRKTGARVLDAQPVRGGYRVKVLTSQGEVRVYFVDAETGAMQ